VSKAFTNEDTPTPDETEALPRRERRLPITAAGYARLRRELEELAERPSDIGRRRDRVLVQVLESVDVVEPALVDGRAGFGTRVTVDDTGGRRIVYDLVGPDEADLAAGQISIASPVAQALLGKRAGDVAVLRRPKGDVEVTVRSVTLSPR
jgi:transcription elongation GreA/GreB family factor